MPDETMPDRDPSGRLDAAALAALFEQHREGLAGAVRAILGAGADVAAVLQDGYIRALTALRRGQDPEDPVAWTFVIVMNLARDHRRQDSRRRPPAPLSEIDEMDRNATGIDPRTQAETAEAAEAARAAIHRLAEPHKEVFLLRVSGGLSFEAAADALGIPVGTAKTRMRAALARLRTQLAGFAPEQTERRTER